MNRSLIQTLKKDHPDVTLIMASKYLTAEEMTPFVDAGIHDFGENRVEAFLEKKRALKASVTWHFIGTLQSKKVKKVIHEVDVLHTLDRVKLIETVHHLRTTPMDAFIQFNISNEPSKHGFSPEDLDIVIEALKAAPMIHPIGVMGMAEATPDRARIAAQFDTLVSLKNTLHTEFSSLSQLSMGMSDDYDIALEKGATHLRLGRILLEE